MRLKNREDAGQKLAEKLEQYKDSDCIVYALPRGGVPIGAIIAKHLRAPLDLIIPRKIGHPSWAEYAVCAITEDGRIVYKTDEVKQLNPRWLKQAIGRELTEVKRRRRTYLGGRKSLDPKDKVAIIIDDGLATGLTMQAAITEVEDKQPARTIVAVPVGPSDVMRDLSMYVDEVVVLKDDPEFLGAVGTYYDEFNQVSDEEVVELLNRAEKSYKLD